METMKINQLEVENVKRIKAVKVEPTANGLTIIGGNNNQGKTSVLDAIAWALGGDRYRPSQATRDGSLIPPNLHIVMSNGLVVERKGKNSDLKVTDPSGKKGGQQLLNEFVNQLALDSQKINEELEALLKRQEQVQVDLETARKSAADLQDESTAELEASITNIEEINRKVRANLDKDKAEDDAREYHRQYDCLTKELYDTRQKKTDLLKNAPLPLPELSVEDGNLVYKGQQHVRF